MWLVWPIILTNFKYQNVPFYRAICDTAAAPIRGTNNCCYTDPRYKQYTVYANKYGYSYLLRVRANRKYGYISYPQEKKVETKQIRVRDTGAR